MCSWDHKLEHYKDRRQDPSFDFHTVHPVSHSRFPNQNSLAENYNSSDGQNKPASRSLVDRFDSPGDRIRPARIVAPDWIQSGRRRTHSAELWIQRDGRYRATCFAFHAMGYPLAGKICKSRVDAISTTSQVWMPHLLRVTCGCHIYYESRVDATSTNHVWMPHLLQVMCGCHIYESCVDATSTSHVWMPHLRVDATSTMSHMWMPHILRMLLKESWWFQRLRMQY